ncbi:hypothetical protein ACLI4Z_11295 [Natrialbaceae archaeon A-arb3/5]
MKQCPRRTLLGGIGTTIGLAVAGSAVASNEGESASGSNGGSSPAAVEFGTTHEYLPASIDGETLSVTTTDFDRWLEADHPHEPQPAVAVPGVDADAIETYTVAHGFGGESSSSVTVLTGEFEFEDEPETREIDGVEYELYEEMQTATAVTDEAVITANDTETLEDAVAAGAGEETRLLDDEPTLEDALETYDDADQYVAHLADEGYQLPSGDSVEIEYVVQAMTVVDPDTIEMKYGIAFEDESVLTDEVIESLEGELAYMATTDEPTIDIDGNLVTAVVERDLAAERAVAEHDSPGSLRPERDIDLEDDGVLEIEIGRGDPTPVEDLTFEVGDEEYDPEIWADGQGTIEEGDTIVLEMDDVEPNLSIRLRHDHEMGSSSSGTTILGHFRFEFESDIDAETVTVEYADEFPLDGDDVHLAAYDERPTFRLDEDEPEPYTTAQPWTGETLSAGDTAELEGVSPGDEILVGWDGVSRDDSLRTYSVRPPGVVDFEYEYADETLSATLRLDDDVDERPTDEYELRIDDEPAETQWTDEVDTVSSSVTVELENIEVGANVTAVWGDDVQVGWTNAQPHVELELDEDAGEVEHVGGDSLSTSELGAQAWADDGSIEFDLDEEVGDTFEEGDTFSIDDDVSGTVTLLYGDQTVGHAF